MGLVDCKVSTVTEIHPSSLNRFIRAVAILALSAEAQLEYLTSIGVPDGVDELALEFDDGRLLVRQFEELGWISAVFRAKVDPLNALLEEMSGETRAELWTRSALMVASEWERVRSLARNLLFAI